jgi:hypothetical protein
MTGKPNYIASGLSFITVCIGIAVVIFGAIKMGEEAPAPDVAVAENSAANMNDSAAVNSADSPPSPPVANKQSLIDGCYHIDSCSYSKIESRRVLDENGREQLVEAHIAQSTASSENADRPADQLAWEKTSKYYAICSTKRPIIIFRTESSWLAEELDLTAISGVEQDSANMYQAICHNAFSNEVGNDPKAYGYDTLQGAARGQFAIESPESLFAPN